MILSYNILDPFLRRTLDLREHQSDIKRVISSFKMVELVIVTKDYYTIEINTDNVKTKNYIVRALGHHLATNTELGKLICTSTDYIKARLFVEKKSKRNL